MSGLEIIKQKARGKSRGKLLFVHGICVGAWVWEKHFLPYFAAAGFDAHALSLRGHGNSEGYDRINQMNLASYAADVAEAVETIGGPLIVAGHSLGGAVVQHWRKLGGEPSGTALLASAPPWGLGIASMRMAVMNPSLFQALAKVAFSGVSSADKDVLRAGLFSADLPESVHDDFDRRVQNESPLVGMELSGFANFAPAPWPTQPTFVLGAADDQLIPVDEVWRTAAYYGTTPVIVPNLAHSVMLETRWEDAAKPLLEWAKSITG